MWSSGFGSKDIPEHKFQPINIGFVLLIFHHQKQWHQVQGVSDGNSGVEKYDMRVPEKEVHTVERT